MTLALIGMICAMSMMPGSSTAVILDTTWSYGRGPGFLAALGGSAGVAVYTGLAVAAGTLLSSDGMWVHVLEGVGALYLAALGTMALIEAASLRAETEQAHKSSPGLRAALIGFMSTILSPKTALFYLVILSQHAFVGLPAVRGILLAGLLHICFRLIWYGTWIHLIEPVRRTFKTVWMQRALKISTATMMLALSIYIFR